MEKDRLYTVQSKPITVAEERGQIQIKGQWVGWWQEKEAGKCEDISAARRREKEKVWGRGYRQK